MSRHAFRFCFCLILATMLGSLGAESKGWKIVQSLAVPGLGQIRDGQNYGYAMLAGEVGIISTMYYLKNERGLKAQEYYEYALKFAHIRMATYPDKYYRDMSRFNSSGFEAGGYNAQIRLQAMQMYPNDPVQQQSYIDQYAYSDEQSWNWDSLEKRSEYSKIRVQAQNLSDYSKVAVGVLLVNHLISGIDALRSFSEQNGAEIYLGMRDDNPLIMLKFEW